MIQNYFKTTYRRIQKNKTNFLFKIGGLTVAWLGFVVIALYVTFQWSFDKYHIDYESIYRLNSERNENGKQEKYGIVPTAVGPMLQNKFPEVAAYTRIIIGNTSQLKYEGKIINGGFFAADSSLFDVFTFKFIHGNKNALKTPNAIVLTKNFALKLFGPGNPIQKQVTLSNNGTVYEVTAVIEDMPSNSHVKVDGFIPLLDKHEFSVADILSPPEFVDKSSMLYVRLNREASEKQFEAKLETFFSGLLTKREQEASGFRIFVQPLHDVYFDQSFKYDFSKKGNLMYLYIFIGLGIFILVSGGINYINLSMADFSGRSREMGIRKVMGAFKKQIVAQVVLETVICCIVSLIAAVLLLYIYFPQIAAVLDPNLQFSMLEQTTMVTVMFIALALLIILSTAIPAFWLTTGNIINSLKGSNTIGNESRLSKALLIVQFVISIVCISATLMINRQLNYIHTKDIGINRENLLVLTMPEEISVKQLQAMKQEFKSLSGVANVSNSSFRMGGGYWKDWYTIDLNGEMKSFELYEVFSDDELFKTLGMTVIEGRTFNAGLPADSGAAFVINETAMRELGWKDPIGKRIFTHPEEKGKWDGTVVGVVKDINISTLHKKIQPTVMRLPWQNEYPELFVYVRIDGNIEQTVKRIEKRFSDFLPGYPLEYYFVDEYYNNQYQRENRAFASLQLGTLIIMLISSFGIFSLSLYMSIKRTKEFGIRKILGATVSQIIALHMSYFIRAVIIANLIALPFAYWLMRQWLDGFAYRTDLSSLYFVAVFVISLLSVAVSGGYSSWQVGRKKVIEVIKSE